MKSIMQDEKRCYLCGSYRDLERHHIFGGANRHLSEVYGLTVYLCHSCHNEPPYGVHHNAERMLALRQEGQRAAMERFGWDEDNFRALFGRNYL